MMNLKKIKIIFHLKNENVELEENSVALSCTLERYINECNNGCDFIECSNCIIQKSNINYIEFIDEESEENNNGNN